jgi:hypothetical protein
LKDYLFEGNEKIFLFLKVKISDLPLKSEISSHILKAIEYEFCLQLLQIKLHSHSLSGGEALYLQLWRFVVVRLKVICKKLRTAALKAYLL